MAARNRCTGSHMHTDSISIASNGIQRRRFLSLLGSALVVGRSGGAQQAAPQQSRPKGPLVWLDMDQRELDEAYTQSIFAPNMQQVMARWASNSEATRRLLGPPRRFAYGPTAVEALDVYPTNRPGAPIHVFIHGGAWRDGRAADYAFPAELFVHAGAHYVVLDFVTVQDANGSLMPMAEQVRRAVAWLYRNARTFNGDPDRLYVSGHSSGAHLAAVAMTTEWRKDFDLPADIVKGGLCCSGLFDLRPVRLSARSQYVRFTDALELALSPQRHLEKLSCPVVVAHGTLESPEFQRQSRDFVSAVKTHGKPAQLLVAQGYNHFEILETLANPYGVLGRAALEQMGLAVA